MPKDAWSDTPETDALDAAKSPDTNGHHDWKFAYFHLLSLARSLERRLRESESERLEQARLLGISGSREAELLAQIAELEKRLREAEDKIESLRIIANVNGDWTVKFAAMKERAERAEASLATARRDALRECLQIVLDTDEQSECGDELTMIADAISALEAK